MTYPPPELKTSNTELLGTTTGMILTAVVAIAPGLGQPRPRRLGEARGLHLHEADADAIVVRTFLWSRGDWALSAERRFQRS